MSAPNKITSGNQITHPADNQLYISCTLDMDYFEVTKLEPLKKYEENVHMFNKIFSKPEMNCSYLPLNEEPSELRFKVNNILSNKFSKQEIICVLDEIKSSSVNDKEELLIKQVLSTIDEYEKVEDLIKKNKKNFTDKRKKFNDLANKSRHIKNLEEDFQSLIKEISEVETFQNTCKNLSLSLNKQKDKENKAPFTRNEVISYTSL